MHFFVSYAKKDTPPLALGLAKALEAPPDMTAWVDQELRATGSIWSRQIEREIQRCDYMVVLLSPDVNRSEEHVAGESFVLKEIEYMIQLKKARRIIVVMAQDTLMPLMLTGKQYIDFRGQSDAEALADRICDEVGIPRTSERRAALEAERIQAQAAREAARVQAQTARPVEPERAKDALPADRSTMPTPNMGTPPQPRRGVWAAGAVLVAAVGIGLAVVLNSAGANVTPATTVQSALEAARVFSGTNVDWQAQYPDGFIHTFEDGVPMVLVPAGCFMMGSNDGLTDEWPSHEVCFYAPFWIDRTEVTQGHFNQLSGVKASVNRFDGPQRPVESITWFEARDFCARRGARLPTEREWEYAARGPDSLIYPWGDTWNAHNAVWNRNSLQGTANVGSIPGGRSWAGAFDLGGNVWEWVSSLYLPYDSMVDREADTGNRTDISRVLRGGSFVGSMTELRSAYRNQFQPDFVGLNRDNGFRCARSS